MTKKKNIDRGTALVTGGAKRIGKSICIELSLLGYRIALHYYISKKEAEQLASDIAAIGGSCQLFPCDLSDEKAAGNLIQQVHRALPDLSLLVNNASLFEKSSLASASTKSFNDHMAVNLKAPFILMRDFAKICRGGQVINIIDTNYVKNRTDHFTYLLSKKSLSHLTKMAAVELAPEIRVNAIAPGYILPPENATSLYLRRLKKNIPLKQKGDVNNITQSIEFLIENPYITGQTIFNDGGEHLI